MMEKDFEDDHLKKIFRSKLKDFEPKGESIPWPVRKGTHSGTKGTITILSIMALVSVITIPATQSVRLTSNEIKSESIYIRSKDLIQSNSTAQQLSSKEDSSAIARLPNSANTEVNYATRDAKVDRTIKKDRLAIKNHSNNNDRFPKTKSPLKKVSALEEAAFNTAESSFTRSSELDKQQNAPINEFSKNFSNNNALPDSSILNAKLSHQIAEQKSASNNTISENESTSDSVAHVAKHDSLSQKNIAKRATQFSISGGFFINSNRFAPISGDGLLIQNFSQSKNIFKNRLGLELSLTAFSINARFIEIKPVLKYMFLHKSYSFEQASMQDEAPDNTATVNENNSYHFTGIGFTLTPQKTFFGRPFSFEGSLLMLLNDRGYSFAKKNVELGISTVLKPKIGENRTLTLMPHIRYSIPLGNFNLFSTNMINAGFTIMLYEKKNKN